MFYTKEYTTETFCHYDEMEISTLTTLTRYFFLLSLHLISFSWKIPFEGTQNSKTNFRGRSMCATHTVHFASPFFPPRKVNYRFISQTGHVLNGTDDKYVDRNVKIFWITSVVLNTAWAYNS